jgi:UDP-2,4-diacetamido-2,4,6-trideoxy-beta-L-altropyranose hydrolase
MCSKRIFFRVDSSSLIGTGHFWRCHRLAAKLKLFGKHISFITASMMDQHKKLVLKEGYKLYEISDKANSETLKRCDHTSDYGSWLPTSEIQDALLCKELLIGRIIDTHCIIVDHYSLGQNWEKQLAELDLKIVIVDDLANRKHHGNLLIDQNWFGKNTSTRYDSLVNSDCELLLGPDYFMNKFDRTPKAHVNNIVRLKILVYAGGTNDPNKLLVFARLAAELYAWNKNLSFEFLISKNKIQSLELFYLIKKSNGKIKSFTMQFSNILEEYDFLICAGGTTLWEREYYHIPAAVISIAENQVPVLKSMARTGMISYIGHYNSFSRSKAIIQIKNAIKQSRYMRLKSKQIKLVDGNGLQRVAKGILAI